MARHPDREAVYEVADLFRQRCLIEGRSLLWPDCEVWTIENLDRLWNAFVEHPDEGKESFVDKFRKQLAAEPVDVHRIAVDLAVVYCLFPSAGSGGMGGQAKLNLIESIRSASLANASPDQVTWEKVSQSIDEGIGSPGTNYLNKRPFHFAFYLRFARQLMSLKIDVFKSSGCEQVADDAVIEIKSRTNLTPRLSRHMILHLLFPEKSEGIASSDHKRKIFQAFANEAGVNPASDVDDGLLAIRQYREATYGKRSTQYYDPDTRVLWDSPDGGKIPPPSDPVVVKPTPVGPVPMPTLDALARTTHLDESFLREIDELLREKGQLIFEGPPGSGKTFVAEHFAHWFTGQSIDGGPNDHVEIVQFHQSYGYEDFVQGIRPETSASGQLTYTVRDGIFLDMCRRARDRPGEKFVLLIDEINRGNISRIFGELLLLLEYRNKRARLPYATGSDPYISIPKNLFIIGTMNSADRSLAQVDYALRRRFYFVRFMPVENGEATVLARWLQAQHLDDPGRQRVLTRFVALNRKVSEHLSPDFQIGHSYFMNANVGQPEGMDRIWMRAIQPLLEEYFHHHRERVSILAEIRAMVYTATTDAVNDVEPADAMPNEAIAG